MATEDEATSIAESVASDTLNSDDGRKPALIVNIASEIRAAERRGAEAMKAACLRVIMPLEAPTPAVDDLCCEIDRSIRALPLPGDES